MRTDQLDLQGSGVVAALSNNRSQISVLMSIQSKTVVEEIRVTASPSVPGAFDNSGDIG